MTDAASMRFEWDPAKADANLVKHGISFLDARLVFLDPDRVTVVIERVGLGERRFMTLGASDGFVLAVVWTPRLVEGHPVVRMISVRKAHESERTLYPAQS